MPPAPPDPAAGPVSVPGQTRTIKVGPLARVEGEGKLRIVIRNGRLEDVQLRVFEAPRFYEALLRGRSLYEAPDITARICGICPVAYQMSSCHALEQIPGVRVDGALRELRRLLYCGEWIESHTLHMFLLHAPDFFGHESAISMAQARPEFAELVRNSLRLKKAGNAIVSLLGGREIHPINVRVGGFYRVPARRELEPLARQLDAVRDFARDTVRWAGGLDFPPAEQDYEFVALRHEDEYPMNEGRLVSSRGLDIAMPEFLDHFEEYQAPHSNALHCRRKAPSEQGDRPPGPDAGTSAPSQQPGASPVVGTASQDGGAYFTGPLARWNLNRDRAGDSIQQAADEAGIAWPCRNPHMGIVARALEVLYAVEEALRIIDRYQPPDQPAVPCPATAGTGAWITEAPRGILFHQYETDAQGLIVQATIVPPTSQNQLRMEEDLRSILSGILDQGDDEIAWQSERLVRSYDPCISCATHFLKVKVERR